MPDLTLYSRHLEILHFKTKDSANYVAGPEYGTTEKKGEEKRHSGVRENLRTLQQTAKLGSKAEGQQNRRLKKSLKNSK